MNEITDNTSRRDLLKYAGAVGLTGLAGCAGNGDGTGDGTTTTTQDGGGTTQAGQDSVRAAWLYISNIGDRGWSWAHDQGRQWCDEQYDWLETSYSEAVPPADAKSVFEQYTNQGYDIIFGTTFEYMNPMFTVAQENPDTLYEHATGYKTRENMGRYMGRIYQARFLSGIAAGMITESDHLGYVAAFPLPEVVRGINAYALGASMVNDDVEVSVRWINAWYDPTKTRQAAQALIDQGVDVMAQHMDSPAAVRTARENGIWSIGYDSPMGEFGGDKYITSPIWNWEAFYAPTLLDVKEGEWVSDFFWGNLSYVFQGTRVFELDDWGPQVPQNVKDEVAATREELMGGDRTVWQGSKFEGSSETFLFREMSSFVESVNGTVPN
ncbi:MAG: BMP family ABC transporter substrate-binding protein [Halobacteriales archaeon]